MGGVRMARESVRNCVFVLLLACGLGILTLGIGAVATGTADARDAALEVPSAALTARQTVIEPFCGIEFAWGDDLPAVRALGVTVVLQTFRYNGDPAEWLAQLDLAQSHGLHVVAQLWPEGWTWDGEVWHIDAQAESFLRTVAGHPATWAVYALHEPYWRGCSTCGLTTAEQQALYQAIKAIADVPLYSEVSEIAFWARQGEETTLADGVCDYCGATYYPFYADGSYDREGFISHLDADVAAIQELAPNSKLVWGMQVFAQFDSPEPRRMPTAAEIADIGAIVAQRKVDGIFWYVWWFNDLYDDFLSNHPELFPAVAGTPFCCGTRIRLSTAPQLRVYPGYAVSTTLAVTASCGFTTPVSLSLVGAPKEIASVFDPNPVFAPGDSQLYLTTTVSTVTGTYPMTIIGTTTGVMDQVTATTFLTLTVIPSTLTLSAGPEAQALWPGAVVTYTLSVAASDPRPVTLDWEAPAGTAGTFDVNPVIPPGASRLSVRGAGSLVFPGRYTTTVTGRSPVATDTVGLILLVASASPSFTLQITPLSRTLQAGQAVTFTGLVQGQGGFNQPVHLDVAWLPAGVEARWQPNPILPGSATVLTLEAGAPSSLDRRYPLLATASSGADVYVKDFELIVLAAFRLYLPLMLQE
jgi:hypothetical protein